MSMSMTPPTVMAAAAPAVAPPAVAAPEEDKWYEPAKYARTVTTVVTRSCITAKVLFGIVMILVIMGATVVFMVSPVSALGVIIQGLGMGFVILMNYDMACKLGYERFMQIAIGFIILGFVIMTVSTGSMDKTATGPRMLTPAMVASKTIQSAHRARIVIGNSGR